MISTITRRDDKKMSDDRGHSCTVGLPDLRGFWDFAPILIVDGGCVDHMRCIRNIIERLEAHETGFGVLLGMLGQYDTALILGMLFMDES